MKEHTFTVKMDGPTAEQLAALAAGTELSRGAVVRVLIRQAARDTDRARRLIMADALKVAHVAATA
jgi:predicted transcriptional regulator